MNNPIIGISFEYDWNMTGILVKMLVVAYQKWDLTINARDYL